MINVEVELPSDDFYFQWIHIYLWQLKFNVAIQMEEELKRLGVRE